MLFLHWTVSTFHILIQILIILIYNYIKTGPWIQSLFLQHYYVLITLQSILITCRIYSCGAELYSFCAEYTHAWRVYSYNTCRVYSCLSEYTHVFADILISCRVYSLRAEYTHWCRVYSFNQSESFYSCMQSILMHAEYTHSCKVINQNHECRAYSWKWRVYSCKMQSILIHKTVQNIQKSCILIIILMHTEYTHACRVYDNCWMQSNIPWV